MNVVKSSFFRLFVGGFAMGAVGMLALQPGEMTRAFGTPAPVAATR